MKLNEVIVDVLKEYIDDLGINYEEIASEIIERTVTTNPYAKAYVLLMDYWDSLPDEAKPEIDAKLKEW